MGTNKITGMGDPTASQDAATKTYVDTADALKLNLSGGTLSGDLNLGTNDITNAGTITGTFAGNVTGDLTGNAATATDATNAENVTVTDESSDTTCYPLFVTTNTGTIPPKVGSNLTFDSSTGALTATSFVGVGTLSSLTTSGDISMTGTGALGIASGTTAQRPSPSAGMLRYNSTLGQFEGYTTAWGAIGGASGGATGGGSDKVFQENENTVTTSYALSTNTNAMSVGNLTINNGVTITIGANQVWVVL